MRSLQGAYKPLGKLRTYCRSIANPLESSAHIAGALQTPWKAPHILQEHCKPLGKLRARLQERCKPLGKLRTRLQERCKPLGKLRARLQEHCKPLGKLRQIKSEQNLKRRTCHKCIHPFGMSPAVRRHQVVIQKQLHSVMFRSPKGQGQTTAEAETVALRDGDVMKL